MCLCWCLPLCLQVFACVFAGAFRFFLVFAFGFAGVAFMFAGVGLCVVGRSLCFCWCLPVLLLVFAFVFVCVCLSFSLFLRAVAFVFALMFVWPMLGWSFMPPQQARLIALSPERAPVMMALNAASIYVGAALGSALGGVILNRWGLGALGIGGGIAACWALVHLVLSNRGAHGEA